MDRPDAELVMLSSFVLASLHVGKDKLYATLVIRPSLSSVSLWAILDLSSVLLYIPFRCYIFFHCLGSLPVETYYHLSSAAQDNMW